MSRQFFKIFSLAMLAIAVALGTTAAQKGGGGGDTGNILPLKASFSEGPIDLLPVGIYGEGKIRNDSPNTWYTHQGTKAGQTQIYIYQPSTVGRLVLNIHEASGGHPVTLYFDTPPLYPPVEIPLLPPNLDCVPPFFIYPVIWPSIQIEQIKLGTTFGCQRVYHPEDGGWAEIIPLTGPRDYFNFTKMRLGETKIVCGVGNTIQFTPKDLESTPNDESIDMFALFQEPQYFTVTATDFNYDGVMDWILKPYSERYKAYTKINNVDTFVDFPLGGIPRRVTSSSYRSCDHGTFIMPWELKLTPLK